MNWIPVTERMPKASDEHTHDDDVLLYIPPHDRPSIVKGGEPIHFDGGIYLGHPSMTESPADEDGKTNFWGIPIEASNWIVWGYSYFYGEPKPTHWMPLPAKPREGSDFMTDTEREALCARIDELCAKVEQGKAENAKLVDVLHEVEQEAIYAYNCLQQDCEAVVDGQTHFFNKWWHAECECDRAKSQNAKLLKLLEDMKNAPCCGDYCWMELPQRLRDAGIEVPS